MLKFVYVTGAFMLAIAPPAVAQAPAETKASEDETDVNRIVCQREEQIGSRLGAKRVCLTVKEWRERAQASREETERVQHMAPARPSG